MTTAPIVHLGGRTVSVDGAESEQAHGKLSKYGLGTNRRNENKSFRLKKKYREKHRYLEQRQHPQR